MAAQKKIEKLVSLIRVAKRKHMNGEIVRRRAWTAVSADINRSVIPRISSLSETDQMEILKELIFQFSCQAGPRNTKVLKRIILNAEDLLMTARKVKEWNRRARN